MTPTTGLCNRRRVFREALNATTILRIRDKEFLCKTCDITENGLGFVLRDASVEANEAIEADVLIGNVVKTFRGVVLYARPVAHGPVRVGMRFADYRQAYDPVATHSSELAHDSWWDEGDEGVRSLSGSFGDISDRVSLDALVGILIRKGVISQEEFLAELDAGPTPRVADIQARDTGH
jgi:hypothetical protein